MRLLPLRIYNQPDIVDYLVHFTGRVGPKNTDIPKQIIDYRPEQRLAMIIHDKQIRAFSPYGNDYPSVCFTECVRSSILYQIYESERYKPWGIAFSKDFIFQKGGGPALYIRGDEWINADSLPISMRARAIRYWPGATPDPGEELPWYLERQSEWVQEREWRIFGMGDPPGLRFSWSDIKFIIAPDQRWLGYYGGFLEQIYNMPGLKETLSRIPVVSTPSPGIIEDPHGVWFK